MFVTRLIYTGRRREQDISNECLEGESHNFAREIV